MSRRVGERSHVVLIKEFLMVGSTISHYKIIEKRSVQLPKSFVGVFKCPNPTCISNRREPITPEIYVLEKEPPLLQCKYCARILQPEELAAEI